MAGRYSSFGEAEIEAGSSVTNNLRFGGQYFDDETGLHYNYYRYYDPKTGRFTTPDPIWLMGGINLFAYVKNDPVNNFDPFGLFRFGKRPFYGLPFMNLDPIHDALNIEVAHEHGFFEDGSGENIGFFGVRAFNAPGIVRQDDPGLLDDYQLFGPHYDDDIMREAISNIGGGTYNLIGRNCQVWAERARQEYERLRREREQTPCP